MQQGIVKSERIVTFWGILSFSAQPFLQIMSPGYLLRRKRAPPLMQSILFGGFPLFLIDGFSP